MFTFYLGTHLPNWVSYFPIPLFISRKRLEKYKTLPIAKTRFAIDSGAFSEISSKGEWSITPKEYTKEIRRYINNMGWPDFVAPQDWMCEPHIVRKTGLSVKKHQELTVNNYINLKNIAPEIPWIPVIQGYSLSEYISCIDMYNNSGIDLSKERLVGLGSVCRRQNTQEGTNIIEHIHKLDINIHAFGFKTTGLYYGKKYLKSSDSMSWSIDARYRMPIEGCLHSNCANCPKYAQRWYETIMELEYGKYWGTAAT